MHRKIFQSNEPLPVFVFIHGGAFVLGSPESYGYDKPVDDFVRHGVIFVTIAYRLGPFGNHFIGKSVRTKLELKLGLTLAILSC